MHQTLGLVAYFGRRYDRTVHEERRAVQLAPQLRLAREFLALGLIAQGQPQQAIETCQQAAADGLGDMLPVLGRAYLAAGDRTRAESVRQQLLARQPVPAAALAQWYAAAGNNEAAFEMLDRSVERRPNPLLALRVDPVFDGLRKDPRFDALLRKSGLQ